MNGWLLFWTAFLAGALLAFALLGVVVSARGLGDVRAMLARLAEREEES